MDAKTYLKELKRLTNGCNIACDDCRLYDKMACECQEHDESIGVDIVEQWAKDCPSETVLDVFRRHYPNFMKDCSGSPEVCLNLLDNRYKIGCNDKKVDCEECWNQPAINEPPKRTPKKNPQIKEDECCICKYTDKNLSEWPCRICSNAYTNEFRI